QTRQPGGLLCRLDHELRIVVETGIKAHDAKAAVVHHVIIVGKKETWILIGDLLPGGGFKLVVMVSQDESDHEVRVLLKEGKIVIEKLLLQDGIVHRLNPFRIDKVAQKEDAMTFFSSESIGDDL